MCAPCCSPAAASQASGIPRSKTLRNPAKSGHAVLGARDLPTMAVRILPRRGCWAARRSSTSVRLGRRAGDRHRCRSAHPHPAVRMQRIRLDCRTTWPSPRSSTVRRALGNHAPTRRPERLGDRESGRRRSITAGTSCSSTMPTSSPSGPARPASTLSSAACLRDSTTSSLAPGAFGGSKRQSPRWVHGYGPRSGWTRPGPRPQRPRTGAAAGTALLALLIGIVAIPVSRQDLAGAAPAPQPAAPRPAALQPTAVQRPEHRAALAAAARPCRFC
jgi:hypothetical protein